MATKPKAILSTHDGREASPITKASNVLFENGQTAQDILNDRQDAMISPVIENSSSMFKVGQGDNVDYSANVVNGAYESMVLKGKSMVNCIQEPSSQDVVLPYEFEEGQYVTINDTKESGALGVELKGQTLVNLIKHDTREGVTLTAGYKDLTLLYTLKPSTQYTLLINIVSTNNDHSGDWWCGLLKTGNWGSESRRYVEGINKLLFTTQADSDCSKLRVRGMGTTFKDAILLEGDWTNIDTPYFTGMTSCKMPILHTIGKNLCDTSKYIHGGLSTNNSMIFNKDQYRSYYMKCKPSTTYVISVENSNNRFGVGSSHMFSEGTEFPVNTSWFTSSSDVTGQTLQYTVTTTEKDKYLYVYVANNGVFNPDIRVQVEEATSPTSYEAHKSSILSLPEEVVLRSLPNGVCDTFNTRTGVYTQRIGEVVLNGSEGDWVSINAFNKTNVFRKPFSLAKNEVTDYETTVENFMTDKLPVVKYRTYDVTNAQTVSFSSLFNSTYNDTAIYINKNSSSNLSEFKTWLSQNPVAVQYELKTPIVTKINLSSTLKSWNTTTHVYSEIPENTLYPTLSHSNPSYPVILKPSTKYSIVANSYSNSHTNSTINFNLGGATASTVVGNRVTTVTTPSTLSNELLTMSGRGNKLNNVMVIEGDVMGDEPYFEGICDCKSPILSNVGKNLFDRVGCSPNFTHCASWWWEDNVLKIKSNGQTYNSVGFDFYLKKGTYSISVNEPTYIKVSVIDSHTIFETTTTGRTFTVSNDSKIRTTFFANLNTTGVVEKAISNIQLEESTTPTTYESYKSNILSCNGDKIELTEDMFEQGTTAPYVGNPGKTYQWLKENSTPSFDVRRLRLKELIKIQPNTKLILQNTDNFMYAIAGYDANKLSLGTFDTSWIQNTTITIPQDAHYISFSIRKKDDTGITINDFKNTNFTLSEVDKTIVLRSLPSGVCDTLNVETGEYVQRIGEVVANGSENITFHVEHSNRMTFRIPTLAVKPSDSNQQVICDKFNSITFSNLYNDTASTSNIEGVAPHNQNDNGCVYVSIKRSRLSTPDVNGFKQWLSQNPIVVQYELTTPIVKTVDLSGYPFSYENGHVVLSSGSIEQSLTPKVEYSVVTNRNGQIRSNQKMVERHQKQLDQLQTIILANLVNSQYNQTLTTLKYELSRV